MGGGIREEPGDTNFLLELRGLKNAEVTESSPVPSVQGRINARKNWWFENVQLSALAIGVLLTIYHYTSALFYKEQQKCLRSCRICCQCYQRVSY